MQSCLNMTEAQNQSNHILPIITNLGNLANEPVEIRGKTHVIFKLARENKVEKSDWCQEWEKSQFACHVCRFQF